MVKSTQAFLVAGMVCLSLSAGASAQETAEGDGIDRTTAVPGIVSGALSAGKVYQLVSVYSGKCLDVTDHSFVDGTQLQQWNCTGKSNQKFRLIDAYKGAAQLVAQESGQYVKVADESLDNGGIVVQSTLYAGNSPRMIIAPSQGGAYSVKFTNSGKCLDIDGPSAAAGARIHQWDCHGGKSQDWHLVEQSEGLGAKSWSLNNTSVTRDSLGRLFRQATSPDVAYISVDKTSGRDRWAYRSGAYETAYCSVKDHIFLVGANNGKVKALNPDNGQLQWQYEAWESGGLNCVDNYNSIFFIGHNEGGKVRSLEAATGRQRWEYKTDGYASYLGKQGENVLISVAKNNSNTVLSLQSGTGKVKWSRLLKEGEWANATVKGEVFLTRSQSFEKLNTDNGSTAWSFGNGSSDTYLQWNTAGLLYVRQGLKLQRLSSANGSVLWTHNLPESVGTSNSSSTVLRSGHVLVSTSDTSSGQIRIKLLDTNGKRLWETTHQAANAYPLEDSSGKLFLKGPRSIMALNQGTGEILWSFSREFPIASESIYSVETYGDDVYLTYGGPGGRYPPMGIVRLDAKSGAQQWDVWANETTTLVGADHGLLFTNRVMGSGVNAYKR